MFSIKINQILPLLVSLFLFSGGLFAQNVGVNDTGATPNTNAALDVDVSTNDKGILIPRITTAQRTGIAGLGLSDEGLMVYDETTQTFWYWDGIQWVEIASKGANWEVLGNTGTTSGSNFLGTKDNQALDIRTNNILRTRITTKGQIETLNTGESVYLGEGAGEDWSGLIDVRNTFIGYDAGARNFSGKQNTAVGYKALEANRNGQANVAIGAFALSSNTNALENVAVGVEALSTATGQISGNVALGYQAGKNNRGDRNMFIGYQAGAQHTVGDGYLYIDNSDTTTPLIYGELNFLRINGAFQIRDMFYDNTLTKLLVQNPVNGEIKYLNVSDIIPTSSIDWSITGNAGTISTASFLGTTDAEPLRIRTNNVEHWVFRTDGGVDVIATNDLVSFGTDALSSNTSGSLNTAIGCYALGDNKQGRENVAVGYLALRRNTTGSNNVAVGNEALQSNLTGYYNTAVGDSTMYENTLGHYNTAIGYQAMENNLIGDHNTAIGVKALHGNVTGVGNIAIGNNVLVANTGSFNTGVGFNALGNEGGTKNTAIGFRALVTNHYGLNNTATGYEALRTNGGSNY